MHTAARVTITAALAASVALGFAPGAHAAAAPGTWAAWKDVALDLDGDTLALTGDGETYEGTLTVTNLGGDTLVVDLDAGPGCDATTDPATVPVQRQVELAVEVTGCELADGATGTLDLGAGGVDEVTFDVTAAEPVPFHVIGLWFGAAALAAALAMLAFVWSAFRTEREKLPPGERPTATSPIAGLTVGWSVDSWATNITVVSTGLVAVFGASDALDALLGSAPDDAVAHVLVAGVVASLLVSLGPIVAKAAGRTEDTTPLGLLLAGGLTLAGALGLIANVVSATWAASEATSLRAAVVVSGALLGAFLVWYSCKSLRHVVTQITPSPKVMPSHVAAAAAVATPISGDPGYWASTVARNGWLLDAALGAQPAPSQHVTALRELDEEAAARAGDPGGPAAAREVPLPLPPAPAGSSGFSVRPGSSGRVTF